MVAVGFRHLDDGAELRRTLQQERPLTGQRQEQKAGAIESEEKRRHGVSME